MLFQQEIKHYWKRLGIALEDNELLELQNHAIKDLKNRNIAGAIIVPLAFLLGGIATDYSTEHPILFVFLGFALALALLFRVTTIYIFTKNSCYSKKLWLPIFFWSNLSIAIIWGAFSASATFF